MLDLISSIMLASSLGVGVLLSSVYYWLCVNSWGRDKTQIIGSCRSKSLRHDFLLVPTHLEPSIDGDRIKYSPTSANVREKP